ncbi:MAG: hypothetical protein ACOC6J_09355, partial [Spirochaetota bacterium]
TVNMYVTVPYPIGATASDDESGLQSIQWTKVSGAGDPGFADAGSASTTIDIEQKDEGEYVLELTAVDRAGNTSASEKEVLWDRTPPPAPSMGSMTSPTKYARPNWTWGPGAGSDGERVYRYRWNGGSWLNGENGSDATSYIPGSDLTPGGYTLAVSERDLAGNWSDEAKRYVYVDYPVWPQDGQAITDLTPKLNWYDYFGFNVTYDVYGREYGDTTWTQYGYGLSESELQVPGNMALPRNVTFDWKYTVPGGKVPYESPVFRFSTY